MPQPEEVQKVEVHDTAEGAEAVSVAKAKVDELAAQVKAAGDDPAPASEYPKVKVDIPPRWAVDFQPNVTAGEIGLFLNSLGFALDNEALVNRLSMSPGIKFKKVMMPMMGQMRPAPAGPQKRS